MFAEIFENSYRRSGKIFINSDLNVISEECLPTNHPSLLYRLALLINPSGNNEELFLIMKQLHLLETPQERIRLKKEEHARALLIRYFISKPKCLELKK